MCFKKGRIDTNTDKQKNKYWQISRSPKNGRIDTNTDKQKKNKYRQISDKRLMNVYSYAFYLAGGRFAAMNAERQ